MYLRIISIEKTLHISSFDRSKKQQQFRVNCLRDFISTTSHTVFDSGSFTWIEKKNARQICIVHFHNLCLLIKLSFGEFFSSLFPCDYMLFATLFAYTKWLSFTSNADAMNIEQPWWEFDKCVWTRCKYFNKFHRCYNLFFCTCKSSMNHTQQADWMNSISMCMCARALDFWWNKFSLLNKQFKKVPETFANMF